MDRDGAWSLLTEYTDSASLIKHALAVEAAMRAYAGRFGADEELWGNVGLLHDFDYERWPEPENHPEKGSEILRKAGYSEEFIYAIQAHATYLGLQRRSPMDRALFAVDDVVWLHFSRGAGATESQRAGCQSQLGSQEVETAQFRGRRQSRRYRTRGP